MKQITTTTTTYKNDTHRPQTTPDHKSMRYRAVFRVSTAEEWHNDGISKLLCGDSSLQIIKFVPWGEPVDDKRTSNKTAFALTLCNLAAKKSNNQQIKPASMPCSLSAKMWDWIQWKAVEKLIKSRWTRDLSFSMCLKKVFERIPVASSTPLRAIRLSWWCCHDQRFGMLHRYKSWRVELPKGSDELHGPVRTWGTDDQLVFSCVDQAEEEAGDDYFDLPILDIWEFSKDMYT